MTAGPLATVMIVTKDRKDELRQAVASAAAQRGGVEVLVIDDGSTDGTADMIAGEFPGVRLVRHSESLGLVVRRNEGVAAARSNIVISIDDDAVLTAPDIAMQTVGEFDDDRIGAVAIPFANVNRGPHLLQAAPDRERPYVADTFIGTAHAVRRDVFLALGGYRAELFHQGEEVDYCIRLLAAGHVVRLGGSAPIHHFESPQRDFRRMDHYGPRNAILFCWQNVPFPAALVQIPAAIAGTLLHTLQPSRLLVRAGGIVDGLMSCLRFERAPVPAPAYRAWRRMRKSANPLPLGDIASQLAPRG
jgi:GT2 family glycosyltransferase